MLDQMYDDAGFLEFWLLAFGFWFGFWRGMRINHYDIFRIGVYGLISMHANGAHVFLTFAMIQDRKDGGTRSNLSLQQDIVCGSGVMQ